MSEPIIVITHPETAALLVEFHSKLAEYYFLQRYFPKHINHAALNRDLWLLREKLIPHLRRTIENEAPTNRTP